MIETQSRSCEGWFPKRCSHKWFLWNHPSCDCIAITLPS
jgi:hypothetical protein